MHLRHCLWLTFGAALSCSDGDDTELTTPDRLLLVPEARIAAGRAGRLRFVADRLDGSPCRSVDERFEFFALRQADFQDNSLAPSGPPACVEVELEHGGDAMVGFSTVPRRLSSGVLVQQHGKCLFEVRGPQDRPPRPSAAIAARFGLRLELVPMLDPLPLLPGTELPIQVRFDGPPLAGVPVSVETGANARSSLGATDAVGTVLLPIDGPGDYLLTADVEASGQLHRGSLYFRVGAR